MKSSNILKKPLLSEKAYKLMEKGIYTFLIDERAVKSEIARAVEKQFGVNVLKVNVARFWPKSKRVARTRKTVLVGGGKKAIVHLKSGQSITQLSPKSESKKTKDKKEKDKKENK